MPLQERSPQISRFYDRIGSNGWRSSDYFTFSVQSPALRRWIAEQLPTKKAKILSVGCGSGEMEQHLEALHHAVIGLDMSHGMLKRARDRGLRRVLQADAQALPFKAEAFDVVIFVESVGYLHLPTAFKEALRVLRKRGRLMVTTYSGDVRAHGTYKKFRMSEIASAAAASGFHVATQGFLNVKRNSVAEVPTEDESSLLYLISAKLPSGVLPLAAAGGSNPSAKVRNVTE